jgi:hypothetical protein
LDILPKTKLIQEPSKQAAAQPKQHAAQRAQRAQRYQHAAKSTQRALKDQINLLLEACYKVEDDELLSFSRKHKKPAPAWLKKGNRFNTEEDFGNREPLLSFASFVTWPPISKP